MQSFKLIASDLDGTLLCDIMDEGDKNGAAIHEIAKRGILFIPSTGRTYAEIPKSLKDNPDIRYIIYSNGSTAYDKKEKKVIINNEITKETTQRVLNICKKYEAYTCAHINGAARVPSISGKENMEYYQINEYYQKLLGYAKSYENIEELEAEETGAESIVLFFHDDAELEECKRELLEIDGLYVTASVAHNLEIVSANAGKGAALTAFADMLGIKKEEILTIGDSTNDVSMFEASGLSLCAKNGNEEAKRNADKVICSNTEGVVDYVLKNILS